ncbi:MAG TPA: cyclodeaminase/cyclohydrolase family protein [Steroidobacteraceae bacterium]|nr:cyclodeaminase/cyclohydrolase family protein [Steroidobacteraceae bacterium]
MDRLASASPTPGGGGAAAAIGAMGAALLSMAAAVTLGKGHDALLRTDLQEQWNASEALRARFIALVDEDARAYNRFLGACRLPRQDDRQAETRAAAMQAGLWAATQVPLDCAQACVEGIRLAKRSVERSTRNVLGDSGAAALALQAALRICALNVAVNSASLRDAGSAALARKTVQTLLDEGLALAESVQQRILQRPTD